MLLIPEVIERDAMMTWWMNSHALPALQLPPTLTNLWHEQPATEDQRAWMIYIENEFDVPVMAGVVEHIQEQLIDIGFAARPDPIWAAQKVWAKALILQDGSRDLNLPDDECATCELLDMHAGEGSYLKPWQADRRHLDSYRSDFHDVVHLLAQQQVCLDTRAGEVFGPWVDVPPTRLLEAAFPALGRQCLQQHAVQLGWRTTPLDEDDLNYFHCHMRSGLAVRVRKL